MFEEITIGHSGVGSQGVYKMGLSKLSNSVCGMDVTRLILSHALIGNYT